MSHLISSVSSTHTYNGNAEINFFKDEQDALSVTLDTDRLHIRSVKAKDEDYNFYAVLFGDQDVMSKYATGKIKTKDEITLRIRDSWAKRWVDNDPYSGLAVFKNVD